MSITTSAVLVCDDVRREDNGKLMLIGVYGQDIRVPQFPATIVLNVVLRIHNNEPIDTDIKFRWLANDKPNTMQSGHLTLAENSVFLINVAAIPLINIEAETNLEFQWQIGESEWETIYSIPLLKPDSPVEPWTLGGPAA